MTRDEQQAVALAHARRYATEPDRGSLKRIGKEHVVNVLAALDAERAKVAERTRERDAAEADRDTWRHRAEVADHARATLNEHLAAAEKRLAEVTRDRDEARRERDALAAQLAALREAREKAGRFHDDRIHEMDRAFADTAPAAEAYTRRVQAEALESVANSLEAWGDPYTADAIAEIRRVAAEIRGGR